MAPAEPSRHRVSLTARTVALTTAVAAIAVLVAGLVSFPLVRGAAEAQARGGLARLADLTASALGEEGGRGGLLPRGLVEVLRREQVSGYLVTAGSSPPPGVTEEDLAALAAGEAFSGVTSGSPRVFVEGRPVGSGAGVILTQEVQVASDAAAEVIQRLAVALLIGLAIAVVVAVLASRRITRPLRRAADAANRLTAGERGVVVRPEGPAEVANIAESLNRLSAALEVSEGRQREFLLSVSHELRTPLTAVKGYAEALADGVVPAQDVERTGATVRAEAERLDRLVADLLDLARLGAVDFRINPVDVDLTEVGRAAAAVWADRCARENVPFRVELPAHPVPLRTDPVRLRQIVDNLAENALRVTPAGRPIVLAVRAEGPWAVVELRDGGPGLTADDVPVAFEPGVLHDRYRGVRKVGTGFGLALVGRLAVGLGGRAEAGPAAEGGARFTVRLPVAMPPPPGGAPVPLPPPGAVAGRTLAR